MPAKVAKVPQVMQMEALECGAACLAMVLAYHGRWVPLEKVRADCGVSRDGSKASNILKAARSYGLDAKGAMLSTAGLRKKAAFPCIVFWRFDHFVVVDGFRGKHVYVNDPARGEVKLSIDEFDECFTGVALFFEPTDQFEKGGGQKFDTVTYAKKRLTGLGSAIAFIMVTAAITSLIAILNTSIGKVFLDKVISGTGPEWLVPITAIMAVLALISCVVSVLNAVHFVRIQGKIAVVSSSRFMRHLLHLPIGFYEQRMVGDLQQRQLANENITFVLIRQLAPVIVNSIMLVLYLVIMLQYSVLLTAVGLLTVAVNAWLGRYISKKRVNIARVGAASGGKLYAMTVSGIEMVETIKASGAESGYFKRWAGYQAAVNEANVRTMRLNEQVGAIPLLVTEFCNIAVLVLGVWLIVQGAFTPGALLAFSGFISAFMEPVGQMIALSQAIQEMRTQMERVEDVMKYEPDVPVEEDEASGEAASGDSSFTQEKLAGRIDVENLTFGYSPLDPPLIEDLSLHLEPGQWVALVGGSGCGKSTVAKLISGLYKPWSGEIKFDGMSIEDIPRPILRGSLAVADQDIAMFDDSVSDNIKLWDRSIEDYEVIMACRDAGIHEVIQDREGGYSTRVLAGGRNFSGGQLQRLEIARVLAQDPTIIILDEATSALDAQTEADVIKRIRDREITCIVVAHRLSTVRDCDEIIVLEDGKVVERGNHEQLLARDGAYSRLVGSD